MSTLDQRKRTLYVGGLEETVDESILHAAFIPFGEVLDVQIPSEDETKKHRGFGFVTFELEEDAKAAMENMNNSEIFGRTLKVNIAKPVLQVSRSRPIWEDPTYYDNLREKQLEEAKAKENEEAKSAAENNPDKEKE